MQVAKSRKRISELANLNAAVFIQINFVMRQNECADQCKTEPASEKVETNFELTSHNCKLLAQPGNNVHPCKAQIVHSSEN